VIYAETSPTGCIRYVEKIGQRTVIKKKVFVLDKSAKARQKYEAKILKMRRNDAKIWS